MPTVSLCIPTYNAARFIADALASAIAQTFEDIEVLVVDDGSKDETLEIAERYARQDSRIRIHRNASNLGLPGNWDRARELARGEWIMFLFQDDLFATRCVELMLTAARRTTASLLCCRREVSFFPEVPLDQRKTFSAYMQTHEFASLFPGKGFVPAHEFSTQVAYTPLSNFVGEPSCVMLHRNTLNEFGRFNANMIQLVDFEYWARIATCRGIAYVDEPLVTFRVHGKSATNSNAQNALRRDRLDGIILLHEFLHAPAYEALRSSLRNYVLLSMHYFARLRQLKRTDTGRDPQDPSWAAALDYYPSLKQRSAFSKAVEWLYRTCLDLRNLLPGSGNGANR
jgi:glycosyltransferase involved in cell wall biosynthesis